MKKSGVVYLVGAGPGDPGLLTLRGAELIGRADVIIYDALINADFLKMAKTGAEIIYGGKRANEHAIPQDELNALLVRHATEGKTVVRLKGGDPYVFGRGGEEAEELSEAGIAFEVVPGISSVVAAPNYAGIPVTHRDFCSGYTVVTGHQDPAKEISSIDWAQLAKYPDTKIILMGVERIRIIAGLLQENGMLATTPVAMVRWGTTGRQESLVGTLATIADLVEAAKFKAPAVTIVGGVVGLRDRLNWFETRALFGQRVVVTRTREQASQLSQQLMELGAEVLEIPTIKIVPPENKEDLTDALLDLHEYNWLIFTSPNGVSAFFEYFFRAFDDMRDLGGVRIAAVGPATAAKLKELHLKVDVMPEAYVARNIAKSIHAYESLENLRVLIMRAEVASPELPEQLQELGAIVDDVPVYRTVPETEDITGSAARLTEEGADWVTFASSSAVENFHARFPLGALKEKNPGMRFLSIGPETSKTLVGLGFPPDVEASPHTIEGMVKALSKAVGTAKKSKG